MRNYEPPNFIAQPVGSLEPKLYLIRCYECPDGRGKHFRNIKERGNENWAPSVAGGRCAWCQWTPDQAIVDSLYYKEESHDRE